LAKSPLSFPVQSRSAADVRVETLTTWTDDFRSFIH
jgi:hypothetical protein